MISSTDDSRLTSDDLKGLIRTEVTCSPDACTFSKASLSKPLISINEFKSSIGNCTEQNYKQTIIYQLLNYPLLSFIYHLLKCFFNDNIHRLLYLLRINIHCF